MGPPRERLPDPLGHMLRAAHHQVDLLEPPSDHGGVQLREPFAMHVENYSGPRVEGPNDRGEMREALDVDQIASSSSKLKSDSHDVGKVEQRGLEEGPSGIVLTRPAQALHYAMDQEVRSGRHRDVVEFVVAISSRPTGPTRTTHHDGGLGPKAFGDLKRQQRHRIVRWPEGGRRLTDKPNFEPRHHP